MLDQILQNKSDKIEIDIRYNGVLTDPTSVVIKTITDPSGVVRVTDATGIKGSTTGRYYYTVASSLADTLGIYVAVWEFVINGITYQHRQEFEVVTTIRSGYIVPEQVRDMTTIEELIDSSVTTDETLQKYIDKTTHLIDAYLGGSINYSVYTETVRCVQDKVNGGLHIQLYRRPIVSVTSITVTTLPGCEVDLDTSLVRINNEAGYLEYFYNVTYSTTPRVGTTNFSNTRVVPTATVVYTAGYSSVPEQVQMAAVMMVEALYKRMNGLDEKLSGFTLDELTERYKTSENFEKTVHEVGLDEAVGALRLLRGYRQPMRSAGVFGPLG
jgi:hypothetical protein